MDHDLTIPVVHFVDKLRMYTYCSLFMTIDCCMTLPRLVPNFLAGINKRILKFLRPSFLFFFKIGLPGQDVFEKFFNRIKTLHFTWLSRIILVYVFKILQDRTQFALDGLHFWFCIAVSSFCERSRKNVCRTSSIT